MWPKVLGGEKDETSAVHSIRWVISGTAQTEEEAIINCFNKLKATVDEQYWSRNDKK